MIIKRKKNSLLREKSRRRLMDKTFAKSYLFQCKSKLFCFDLILFSDGLMYNPINMVVED